MLTKTGAEANTRPVRTYTIVNRDGKIEVTVTSGTLRGKSARVITSSPAAAYFNDAPTRRAGEGD
jgi:hypothetical protein